MKPIVAMITAAVIGLPLGCNKPAESVRPARPATNSESLQTTQSEPPASQPMEPPVNQSVEATPTTAAAAEVKPVHPPLSDRVKKLADDPNGKIQAIKAYREDTGLGLADAKAAVEAYIKEVGTGDHPPPATTTGDPKTTDQQSPPALSDRVKKLADDPNGKIQAIKAYREETGAGLAAAKDAVEAYIKSKE